MSIAAMARTAFRSVWRPVRPTLNRFGIDLVPIGFYPFDHHLRRLGINVVLDVGANIGQFGNLLRRTGYSGRIVSFEPLQRAFDELHRTTKTRNGWLAVHTALGDKDGMQQINVGADDTLSSFKTIRSEFVAEHEWAAVRTHEAVPVTTLDSLFDRYVTAAERVMLKLDVQGYEDRVLIGALNSLPRISCIQIEAGISPLYEDEPTLCDHVTMLRYYGFRLIDIDHAFRDASKRLCQADILFERMDG